MADTRKKWKNQSGTKTYFAWRSMRSRCNNKNNPSYEHYGARGISVCERWENNFDAFVDDMGECPAGMSLDRIDNEKGYFKENCRWATIEEQLNNQRRNVLISMDGKTQTLSQWAKEIGISTDTLWKRLRKYKIDPSIALTAESLRDGWEHGTRAGYEGHSCRCALCKDAHAERHRLMRAKRKIKQEIAA